MSAAPPRMVDAATVERALDFPSLVSALDEAFRAGREVPLRHHHPIPQPAGRDAMLLLMPAWSRGGAVGIKIVTVYPDNGRRGLPAVIGTYLLLGGAHEHLARVVQVSAMSWKGKFPVESQLSVVHTPADVIALLSKRRSMKSSTTPPAKSQKKPSRWILKFSAALFIMESSSANARGSAVTGTLRAAACAAC